MWEYPLGSGIFSSYMSLMTFNGIWAMYDVTGEARALDLWKKASGPVVEYLRTRWQAMLPDALAVS